MLKNQVSAKDSKYEKQSNRKAVRARSSKNDKQLIVINKN